MNVVLLCLGVWLLLTPSRWRLRLTGRGRPLVKPQDAAALLAGLGVFVVIGGVWGVLCGVAAGLASRGILERLGDHVPKDTDQVLRLAPEAVDCLAACVAAGAPLWSAMSVVGRCFTGPVGDLLARTVARHQLGATYEQTFAELLDDPLLAPVGAVMLRSVESGASLAGALTACAEQMRQVRGADLENRARAVGVKAVLPLAGCFLPAFIVLAVVPIVGSLVVGLF